MASGLSSSVRSTRANIFKFVVANTLSGGFSSGAPDDDTCLWPGARLSVFSCSDTVDAVAMEESL